MNKTDLVSSSRRSLLVNGISVAVAVPLTGLAGPAAATDLPRVDPNDAAPKSLAYVHDASGLSAAERGGENRICATCSLYTGGSEGWGPCQIFPGKQVAAAGWCRAWVAKS